MAITVKCVCGKNLLAKDELAGKKVRCPVCKAVTVVPEPEVPVAILDEDLPVAKAAPPFAHPPAADDDPDSSSTYHIGPPPLPDPRAKRRELRKRLKVNPVLESIRNPKPARQGWLNVNAGMGGGVAMMLIALIWFIVGLAAGWIFFYPPILFIIGIIAFFKGMMNSD